MPRWWTVALLALSGCGGAGADYTLQLRPRVAPNQDPFANGPTVKVVIVDDLGVIDSTDLGELASGSVSGSRFGPLDAATVGVWIEEPGGRAGDLDTSLLRAWGSVGPLTLSSGGEEVDTQVFIGEIGEPAALGELSKSAMLASVVVLSNGDALILHGAGSRSGVSNASDEIYRVASLDTGSWQPELVAEVKDVDGGADYRVDATATVLDLGGHEVVLVAGGRPRLGSFAGNLSTAYLFDTVTNQVTWASSDSALERLSRDGRSNHQAIALANGKVALIGGMQGDSQVLANATGDLFDPATKTFDSLRGTLREPPTAFALASLGASGALVCGGARLSDGAGETVKTCDVLTLEGDVTATTDLPVAIWGASATRLADGTILHVGGCDARSTTLGSLCTATPRGWTYNPDTQAWAAVGNLSVPRVHATVVPLPDGRAAVVGGLAASSIFPDNPGDPVDTIEIYNPTSRTFRVSERTHPSASGWMRSIGWHDAHGAFVLEGLSGSGGGDAYGLIAFPPAL